MKDFNSFITNNFYTNINYLKNNHNTVYQKLSAFDSAVENGHYVEKYSLIFENNQFDVLQKTTNTYLYNGDLSKHTNLSVQSVNKRLDNNLFQGFIDLTFTKKELQGFEKKRREQDFTSYLSYTVPITQMIKSLSNSKQEISNFNKFIFFGVGLGEHIYAIHKKINAKDYLIVEDDLELFRLSLFCTNYTKIAKHSNINFAIFDNKAEFLTIADQFIEKNHFYNHYIKYFQLLSHNEDKADYFHLALTNQPHLRYFFNDLLQTSIQALKNITKEYKFLKNTCEFSQKRFLFIASGPSLEKNIIWLKNNYKNFIIFCVSSTLSFLEKHQIEPNIILHSDPFEVGIKSFKQLNNINFIKNSILLFSASTSENILNICKKKNIYMFEIGTDYITKSFKAYSSCVGSLGYQILLLLQAKEIYLLGLDLAIDPISGQNHISTHQDIKMLTKEQTEDTLNYKETLIKVKGNLRNYIYTTPHFSTSIDIINTYFSNLKQPHQIIYNLSDGAKFHNTISLAASKVKIQSSDKLLSQQKLISSFHSNSMCCIQEIDKQNLHLKLENAKQILNKIKNIKIDSSFHIDTYILNIIDVCSFNENNINSELFKVLDNYLYYILGYIYEYFTSINIDKTNIVILDKLFRSILQDIVHYYITQLESI